MTRATAADEAEAADEAAGRRCPETPRPIRAAAGQRAALEPGEDVRLTDRINIGHAGTALGGARVLMGLLLLLLLLLNLFLFIFLLLLLPR